MEGNSEDGFTDLLLSWSLEQVFDEAMFKHLVKNIPEEFESVDGYLSSYVYPLLEETRAELASSLETVYKAPFAEVVSLEGPKGKKLFYDVVVDYWRNKTSDRGKEPYRTLPGDFLLLLDSKPKSLSDLRRIGGTCTFATVTKIFDNEKDDSSDDETDDHCTSSRFKLRTAGIVGDGSIYVVYLANITTNKRIWKALRMRRNLKIIEKVLVKNDQGEEDCDFCPRDIYSEVEERFRSTVLSKLNESQLEAVLASIRKTRCNHHSRVELIWGPPGTGKTSTLSVLLYILLEMNVRTLICAPTNTAVKELASRVLTLVRNSVETEIGKTLTSSLGGLLLFGNKRRLKVGSDIEEIFLDYRLDRLTEIVASYTGWRPCVTSMLDFLEDCVSQHKIFVENEQINTAELSDDETAQVGTKPFLDYARDRFKNLALPLKNCMLTLITHLPRSFIDDEKHQNIVQLFYLLDSLEIFLFEESGMTSEYLEALFLQRIMTCSGSFLDTTSFQSIRSQCVLVLRSIQTCLSKLAFPKVTDRSSTTQFCYQKASLVFCTVSSAFNLHKADIDPFQLLVIDEAAQVKECETAIALQIRGVRHAILVGDECQLPATVSSKLSAEAGFGRSLFERLSSMGHPKYLLDVQYRMHPSISLFPNSKFYQNQIWDGPNVQNRSYERCYLQGKMFGPYSFINVRGGREEMDDAGVSRRNMVEVAVVVKLVHKLIKAWSSSREKLSIGLISPYAAQVAAIQKKLQTRYDNLNRITVKVKSIDGFQGGEEDIIIISTVRSHKGGSIGFLCSPQRTNVALTRARHCLWILGNESTLSKSDSVWEAIVSDAKDRRCFFNADEDPEIEKAVIDVKNELDQLDDLLSGESTLLKNLRWQVLFSDNFRKSFQNLRSSSTKKLIIHLLVKLAGGWRPRKLNVDWKCEKSSYIVKQFKVDIYYVVCSIDMMRDSMYMQILKVWDILPMTETTKLLKRIDSIASMYTDDFINHCNDKLLEGNLEVPLSWSCSSEIIRFKNSSNTKLVSGPSSSSVECSAYVENSKVSESLLLMKFYSLSTGTVNHLLSDVEGKGVDLPFEVTDEEREIIRFPRSSFILGRSGTGKTTILTMKLYQAFQQYCIASGDLAEQFEGGHKGPVLHQLFVTVSPKLCHAVKKTVAQMKSIATENSSGDSITFMDDVDEVADFKDIPDTFVGIQQKKYPLIITFHKFLMMLDGTVGKSYFQRFPSVRDPCHSEGRRSVALQTFLRKNEVTYDRFFSIYWPHFNDKLIKSLDASRVFTEIMSHIKGGPMEGDYKRNRQDYVSLSESRTSTLCAEQRWAIYDIFEDYEKRKLERGEFDLADFVSDIHLRLNEEDLQGEKMDFIYIDEVQDLTMRQISLFRYICNNVDEGFVFSGDTAQTIARGIDFRFEDIRSLFYNEFLMRSRNCDLSGKREKGLVSDIFNLSYNFRTHTGVLRLAQSVIDLICYYFPHSIDVLAPETSRIYGESPIVLEPGSDENLIISIFGHSGKSSGTGKWVGFGADQAILVRDETAKKEVSNYIGHQALILTIVECKGLEFQDVLLYNFFGSSPLGNHWRVVYEFLKEKDPLDGNSAKSFPSFSLSKHNILCSELKQLYVAITRTRQRLWICENNVEVSMPMLDYWRTLSLVQVRKIDDSLAEAMQRASTPEEWKSQGMKLLWEKNYEMATMCFEKAGEETLEKMARASGHRAAADSLRGSNSVEATRMLREAAEIFDSINRAASAAECFYDLGDYERAGRIYWYKTSEPGKAGECFSLAGKYELAAQVYASGNFFRECLSACAKGNHFDVALQYIEKWKQQALSDSVIKARLVEIDRIVQEFLEDCALKSHKAKDNASLMKYVQAFCSTDSKRKFLISLDCLEELLMLEEELGNFHEASEIAKSLGDTLREVDLLEKAGQLSNACSLLFSYVISNLLWGSGNLGWPLRSLPRKEELLNRVMSVAQKVSETFHASICAQAKFLLYDEKNLSELMKFYNASKQYDAPICEVLVVRDLLDIHFKMNATKYEWDHDLHLDPCSFDQRIVRNQVSGGTLVYVWNLWKEQSLEILECLDSLERTDSIKQEGFAGFCFNYFGLRLPENSSVNFRLLNPDAAWAKDVEGYIRRNRNVATLEARHFASAARKFWLQELVVVGLRVLEALQRLHNNSMKRLPLYCQSMCLLHIFDIAKFLLDSKFIRMKYLDSTKLQNFIQLCLRYFNFVFPSDPRESLSGDMISLRETELSRNLLEECVYTYIGGVRELSSGLIGRAVMTMLGSGKLKHGFYDQIAAWLPNGTHWKTFIENLRGIGESVKKDAVSDASDSLCVQESPLTRPLGALSLELHIALVETYKIHWRTPGYISPPCFLYLLERLLILVSYPQGFFFTTKSAFVEYLLTLQPNANPRPGLGTHNEPHARSTVDFVLQVVEELLYNRIETVEWIKLSGLKCNVYIRALVLRLLMILCVLSVNCGLNFDIFNQKMNRADIVSELPREFSEALRPKRRNYHQFVSAVATAFKLVGDPLVIVVSGDINRNFPYPDAVFLDLRSFSCKTDIMTTLFPRSIEASYDTLPSSVALPPVVLRSFSCKTDIMTTLFPRSIEASYDTLPSSVALPPVVRNAKAESSEMASKITSMSSDNGYWKLQRNWKLNGEFGKALNFFTHGNVEDLKSLHLRNKVEVEEHIDHIASTIPQLSVEQRRPRFSEDSVFYCDDNHLVEDLSTLVFLLRRSEYSSNAMIELSKRMHVRLPQLEALMSSIFSLVYEEVDSIRHIFSECINLDGENGKMNDSTAVEVDEDKDSNTKDSAAVEMVEDEDTETVDSAAVEMEEPIPGNKGAGGSKGKVNKKKNKAKKGKGGKRR